MGAGMEASADATILVLRVEGRFDLRAAPHFREALASVEAVQRIVVDLTATEHVDSSALGLLMLLYEAAFERGGEVELRAAAGQPAELLGVADIERMARERWTSDCAPSRPVRAGQGVAAPPPPPVVKWTVQRRNAPA